MTTDTLLILPPVGRRATGIGHYARRLTDALHDHDDVHPHAYTPTKHEIELFGTTWGGYLSSWYNALVGRLPEADVIHACDLQQLHRKANVLTVHDLVALEDPDAYGAAGTLWRLFARRIPKLDQVITPSHYTADKLTNQLDVDPANVTVAPHGIDTTLFKPYHKPDALDQRYGYHVATVGEWRPRKQTLELCHALADLTHETSQPLVLHHAGPHRVNLATYEQRCHDVLDDSTVELIKHGYKGDVALATLLSWADVLAYPSREEGFGLPPLEAAACGTPTVTGPCPVFTETLAPHNQHQASDHASSIKDALHDALHATPRREKLRRHAQQYTWQRSAEKHAQAYTEAMA